MSNHQPKVCGTCLFYVFGTHLCSNDVKFDCKPLNNAYTYKPKESMHKKFTIKL